MKSCCQIVVIVDMFNLFEITNYSTSARPGYNLHILSHLIFQPFLPTDI